MPAAPRPQLLLTELQKRVLLHLRVTGPQPRIDLAIALRTNSATITRVTQQLVALDLIAEGAQQEQGARGRPSVPLAIAGSGGWSVGATAHPGWLELVLVDFCGPPCCTTPWPSQSARRGAAAGGMERRTAGGNAGRRARHADLDRE